MAAQRRDPEATRSAILDAAEDIFIAKGPDAASTAEIARAAHVTKSLIHHHFGSKQGLWDAVKIRRFLPYHEAQRALLLDPPSRGPALLLESARVYFGFLTQDTRFARFMAWMQVEDNEVCVHEAQELVSLGNQRLEEDQAAGLIRKDIDPNSTLLCFISMVEHWFLRRREVIATCPDVDPETLDAQYLDTLLKILEAGITPAR